MRTLVVTGHFPPSHGGVQRFTAEMVRRMPSDAAVVAVAGGPRPRSGSASVPEHWFGHPVHRVPGRWFTNSSLVPNIIGLARTYDCTAAWVTSALPLGALAPALRRTGIDRITVSTHGMEVGWAGIPVAAQLMRAVSRSVDVVTYLGEFTRPHVQRIVDPRVEMCQLTGGVDVQHFRPGRAGGAVLQALGLADRRVVVTVSRLVPRKGQDMLVRAWPSVLRRHPDAALLVVGDGRHLPTLQRLTAELGLERHVRFAGAVNDDLLPAYLSAAEVFALPCRTVWHGLQPEGLGLSTLEASASGLPVVVGDSGGAPEAVIDGQTGLVVDGRRVPELAEALCSVLDDPSAARRMGAAGRRWVEQRWTWDQMTNGLMATLGDPLVRAA